MPLSNLFLAICFVVPMSASAWDWVPAWNTSWDNYGAAMATNLPEGQLSSGYASVQPDRETFSDACSRNNTSENFDCRQSNTVNQNYSHNIQNNYLGTGNELVHIASGVSTTGDGINVVSRIIRHDDGAYSHDFATEKYFEHNGKACQTNYDSRGQVSYTTAGCPE